MPFDVLSSASRKALKIGPQPEWFEPMLATLSERRFSDPAWIFEPKLDGYRCLAFRKGRDVRLYSRNRIAMNANFPEIVEALAAQPLDRFVVDGEIVALAGGMPSFSALQRRAKATDPGAARQDGSVFFYAFDLPHAAGRDLRRVPLAERKAALRAALRWERPLVYVSHAEKEGERLYEEACRRGWEGLVAKRAASPYANRRSGDWLKFKCVNAQEFVIGGYTDPGGSRLGFGALLLGYYEKGKFLYAGKVGTGYDDETLRSLTARLRAIETPKSAFEDGRAPRNAHWVKPALVAQVGFTEWTPDGHLRHPRFEGLRHDKPAKSVRREKKSPG